VELRRLYDQLTRGVLHAEVVFSKLQLSEARSPERLELVVVFEQTNAIFTALADFLDGLDRELASEGNDRLQARPSLDEIRAFAREIEALEKRTPGKSSSKIAMETWCSCKAVRFLLFSCPFGESFL
jgi:hypothetical protein